MPVPVTCPNCATNLRAPDNAVGRKVKCPKCGGVIAVPAGGDEPIDLANLGERAESPDSLPPAPPPRRRRKDDYEDDDRPRPLTQGQQGRDAPREFVFSCTQDGTYRVIATSLFGMGRFSLSVEER